MMQLVRPATEHLPSYVAALGAGWSPNNERGLAASLEEFALIEADPDAFVQSLDHRDAKGAPVRIPAAVRGHPVGNPFTIPTDFNPEEFIEALRR